MAEKTDLVVAHLIMLFKHKELLAAAYHKGIIGKSDDKTGGRGLYELHQIRALVPYTQDTYRLSSSIAKHLDEVLQAEHLYAAVGADISELAARLPLLSDDVGKASLDGRHGDADSYIDQFDRAVFELSDSIAGALQYLRILTDNKFANVSNYAEKIRQNTFYLDRAKKIDSALTAIQMNGLADALDASPEGDRLLISYRSQISNNLAAWRANLLDITAILRDYLFKIRQIDATARRMRAFALHLKRTPNYVPPDIDALDNVPRWARRAPGFSLRGHAAVQNPANDEPLLAIAKRIPETRHAVVAPLKEGKLLPDAVYEPEKSEQAKPWQEAIRDYLAEASCTPLSAMVWKRGQKRIANVADDIWLVCLLHEESLKRRRTTGVVFEQVIEASDSLSGVLHLQDILVSRSTA
jgi:hypothetical protein